MNKLKPLSSILIKPAGPDCNLACEYCFYLNKIDAWEFLNDYAIQKDWYYLPKNLEIREFVEYFYSVYKKIGNEIDESISKEKYKIK